MDTDIKRMVDRFLGWKLPQDFCPDCGIIFDGRKDDEWNKGKSWPTGTNLLHAVQAEAMFRYVLDSSDKPAGCSSDPSNCPDNEGYGCACTPTNKESLTVAADTPGKPVTVDTPVFRTILSTYNIGQMLEAAFIAYIDAHTARAVAAAREEVAAHQQRHIDQLKARKAGLETIIDQMKAERATAPQQHAQAALSEVVALAWKWHKAAVADGFAASESAQELFELLGWPDEASQQPAAAPDQQGDWPQDFRDVIKGAEDAAYQQGRAAGLEEAAKVCESGLIDNPTIYEAYAIRKCASAIRAIAAKPAEGKS